MPSPTSSDRASWSPLRILWMTFVAALVFSVGLIAGQHWLLSDGIPQAISVGEASASPTDADDADASPSILDEIEVVEGTQELYSFYRALTQSEPQIVGDRSGPAYFTLELSTHSSLESARAELDHLRSLDLDAHLVTSEVDQSPTYTLRIAKFHTEDDAQAMRQELQRRHRIDTTVRPL